MKKRIIVLGCTGSIGKSTLELVREFPDLFEVVGLQAHSNEKQLLDLASSKKWLQYDQDFFNFICGDDVLIMDAKYNFVEDIENIYHSLPGKIFKEFVKSEKDPKIIHYSGNRKPWINISSKYNVHFWKTAENTPFLEKLKKMK
jgi:lipopolysaccharide biosynthesis glycosyltransferase